MDLYPKQQVIYERSEDRLSEAQRSHSVATSPWDNTKKRASTPSDQKKLISRRSKLDGLKELELDGFSSLAEATTWCARIFWLVFLLLVLAILTYEIYKTVDGYVNQPVLTTYTITKNESMLFPSLMVCLGNVFNETKLKANPKIKQAAKAFQTMLFNQSSNIQHKKRGERQRRSIAFEQSSEIPLARMWSNSIDFVNQESFELDEDFSAWIDEDINDENSLYSRMVRQATSSNSTARPAAPPAPIYNMTREEFYQHIMEGGFDLDQIFLNCSFWSSGGEESIPCRDIIQEVLDVNYAKCFLVGVKGRKQTVESRGLSLTINTLNSNNSKDMDIVKRYKGLFLSVDDGEKYNPTSWEKVLVGGGLYMKLDLSLEHLQLINIDTGDEDAQPCVSNEKAQLRVMNASYSLSACQLDCFIDQMVKKCGCLLVMEKSAYKNEILQKNNFCESTDQSKCVIPKVVNDQKSSEEIDECRESCHIQCDSWRYKASPSSMALNPKAFEYLKPIPHTDLLKLDMSYRSLEYKEFIQSYQTTIDTFIGNLGGQITLWIGGSMITLINVPIAISAYLFKKSVDKARRRLFSSQQAKETAVIDFQQAINARIHN